MPRSVNAVASRKRRKKILKLARGYFGRKKNVWTVAKNQVEKGWTYAYRDRRQKKREFRKLWIQRINAAARQYGTSYSQFMGQVHLAGIELNRKVLADLAMNHPAAFKAVYDQAMAAKPGDKKKTKSANKAAKADSPKVPQPPKVDNKVNPAPVDRVTTEEEE